MNGWICQTCGHNRSQHCQEWNKFRGEWNTACMETKYGMSSGDRCRCGEFVPEKKEETA